jgi:hypothetical protein
VVLRDHYQRTTYRVTGVTPATDIRIGQPCPPLDAMLDQRAIRSWAFITAWNPGSKNLDATENRRRQAALEAEVKQNGYVFYRGAGVPDEKGWVPEESILIMAIGKEAAVQLGKQFGQAAIVVGERGALAELIFIS